MAKKIIKLEKKNKALKQNGPSYPIYVCEKCGYKSIKTFLYIFENEEYRFCAKCARDFYLANMPKAILEK